MAPSVVFSTSETKLSKSILAWRSILTICSSAMYCEILYLVLKNYVCINSL